MTYVSTYVTNPQQQTHIFNKRTSTIYADNICRRALKYQYCAAPDVRFNSQNFQKDMDPEATIYACASCGVWVTLPKLQSQANTICFKGTRTIHRANSRKLFIFEPRWCRPWNTATENHRLNILPQWKVLLSVSKLAERVWIWMHFYECSRKDFGKCRGASMRVVF